MGVVAVVACATADDQNPDDGGGDSPHGGGGTSTAGKTGGGASAGTAVSEGGKSSGGGAGGVAGAGKAGAATGGTAQAGGGGAGAGGTASSGGKGGTSSGGTTSGGTTSGGTTSGGATSGGTTSGGATSGGTTGSTFGCSAEAAGGAEAQAGAGAGGAASSLSLFFDDFETGSAAQWTTTLGTWAIVDDDNKAYEQSAQENKLQIAVASGLCAVDQIIDARIKVVGFKGQSNSYVAALFGRVVSPSTHYLLALGSDNKLVLRKRVNSTSTGATAIGIAKTLTVNEGQWYDVHFEMVGTSLKGCVGDVCVTGTDSTIAGGSVGLGTVNTSARFDDIRVTAP